MGCGIGVLVSVLAAAVIVFLAVRTSRGGNIGALPIINSTKPFSKEDTTQVPLTSIAQMRICDKIGNISIKVDPNAQSASVTTTRIVHVSNQAAANQEFQRIGVEIQPPGTITNPLTCTVQQQTATATSNAPTTPTPATAGVSNILTVNVTLPNSDGLLHADSDAADIAVTLPQSVLPTNGPTMLLNVEAPVGNIAVDGISGVLNIRGGTGNISVSHGLLASGSQLGTTQGNITFNGLLAVPTDSTTAGRYYLTSEQGTVDVTLPTTTNVILDVNINVGKINSDFNVPVQSADGGVTYHGPLNAGATPAPTATLLLDVSSGTINLHKTQT
jgi:hypothetical protein